MTGRIFFNRVEIFCLMRTGTFFIRIAAKTRQIGQRSPSYFNQLIGSDQFREYAELVRCQSILYCHAGENIVMPVKNRHRGDFNLLDSGSRSLSLACPE